MELTGSITNLDIDFKTGKPKLTLTINEKQNIINNYDLLKPKELDITIKQHRKKRSVDANAYCWVLIGKIADTLKADKEEVYFKMLRRYGQGAVVKIPNDKLDTFKRAYKYSQEHEKLLDENCTYMRFWIGSSNYNTSEMSVLIDGIVSECNDLEIDTITPKELENLKRLWGKK